MMTKRMGVENVSFVVEKLGEECTRTQQLREFVQNGIEAIAKVRELDPTFQGRINIDRDRYYTDRLGARKLSITDNGEGMTAAQLSRHMNNLASSSRVQGLRDNYGIGAKLASLVFNPAGVMYESWRDGRAHLIQVWKDPADGEYGLRGMVDADGNESFVAPVDFDQHPDIIETHGTKVVLLGFTDGDDTMSPPVEETAKTEWLVKSLNRRYARIPEWVLIRAKTLSGTRAVKDGGMRSVRGNAYMLGACAEASGKVALHGAVAHWWLLPATGTDDWQTKTGHTKADWAARYFVKGHVAVIHRDELYAHRFDTGGRFTLNEFGITAGTECVVVYVEPDDELAAINLSRTSIVFDGRPELPWGEWGKQFRERMPPELAAYVENIHSSADTSVEDDIRRRLSELLDLYAPPRFRKRATGAERADFDEPVHEPAGHGEGPSSGGRRGTKGSRPASVGDRGALDLSDRIKPLGTPSVPTRALVAPRIEWVDDLEMDVAAEYIAVTHQIRANRSFRLFQQFHERLLRDFPNKPGAVTILRREIEKVFGLQLSEVVLGVQALLDRRVGSMWDEEKVKAMLTPAALTVGVCIRANAFNSIRSNASKSLGRSETEEAN